MGLAKSKNIVSENDLEKAIREILVTSEDNVDTLKVFYQQVMELVGKTFLKSSLVSQVKPKCKSKSTTKSSQLKSDSDEGDRDENSKKCPMKTSADVVHRIQWDTEIDRDYIVVGYLDRFLGIKEYSFNTFDWGDIVLADINALAIPQHRINYFKYKNVIIWDKNKRIDDVYGSTGSKTTIYDVIEKLKNVEYVPKMDDSDDNGPQTAITTTESTKSRSSSPNYFLSIPIDCSEIRSNFSRLRDDLIRVTPEIEEILLPESSLHLTLCTLRIDNGEELQEAIEILKTIDFKSAGELKLCFKSLGTFFDKVLYIKSDDDIKNVSDLRQMILDALGTCNIDMAGNYYDFQPHLTVGKIKNNNCNLESMGNLVDKALFRKYENFMFGKQLVTELHLCKMVNIFEYFTYPVEYTFKLN